MTGTGHIPRLDDWPEPEWPVPTGRTLPLRDRLAARFWDALAAFDRWLYWRLHWRRERP